MNHKLNTYRDENRVTITYCELCLSEDQAVLYGQACSGKPKNNDSKLDKKVSYG